MGTLVFSCTLVLAAAIILAVSYNAVVRLSPIQPLPLILPPPAPLSGPFSPNSLLRTHLNPIGHGLLPFPEDVAVDSHGVLYVGCADGWIKRVDPSSNYSVENWVHLGDGHRPLGLAIGHREGQLIVCDPDVGLLSVTRERIELLSEEAQGVKFKLTDAAVVARDGTIYFTDASSKYPLSHHLLDLLESRPHGRLLKYDPVERATTVLMDQLHFANGVALSHNEDFLVVCETGLAQCKRYWLKGEKSGRAEIFVDNLPAYPDNIKSDGEHRFWIALVSARSFYMNLAFQYPFVRQLQLVLGLVEPVFKRMNKRALVLAVSEEGEPLFTLGDPFGDAIHMVTSAVVAGQDLYLGNLGTDFVGHVKLNASYSASKR